MNAAMREEREQRAEIERRSAADFADILRTPYLLGGRTIGHGLDCLGVVLIIAQRIGLPLPDPWVSIRAAWLAGSLAPASGFPTGWVRLTDHRALRTGDVLLTFGQHAGAAIVVEGRAWSANPDVGSAFALDVHRLPRPPAEVWRHDPTAHQARPAR